MQDCGTVELPNCGIGKQEEGRGDDTQPGEVDELSRASSIPHLPKAGKCGPPESEAENEKGDDPEEEVFRPGRLPRWFTKRQQEEALAKSRVIDIPMRWGPGMPAVVEEEYERCSYVGPSDRKCGRRASEKRMCKIHARWELWTGSGWPMTCPEDRESVQEAMRQTLSWLMAGHITEKQALAVVAICRAILRTL